MVVLGEKAHAEALSKIESWKRGENKYSDKELWKARNIIESMEHPQTKEIIKPIGRMSCFVPANIPIQIGMLLAPATVVVVVVFVCRLRIRFCGSGSTSRTMRFSTTATVTRPLLLARRTS